VQTPAETAAPPSPRTPRTYRAAIVGCSRIGAFIDNEVLGRPDIALPYSHAAGYEACPRTDLVAGADLRPDVLEAFGLRYDVPPARLYTDFRAMIDRERPDVVSVATQPEQHAEVAVYAAEHGVRAIYCEKPFCASLEEGERVAAAVAAHGVAFNLGTNRRWHPGYDVMRASIAGGELGELQTMIIYSGGTLFNTTSHYFDLVQSLNGDERPVWAQGYLPKGDSVLDGDDVIEDPAAEGMIGFANGATAHVLQTRLPSEHQAICERGVLTATNNGAELSLRRMVGEGRGRRVDDAPAPAFTPASSTLRLIEDLVQALDTGRPTRGGTGVALDALQMIFGLIESHRRGGARVALPLRDSRLRLNRRHRRPGQPRYTA
jgi:predicted dehydrogenase